MKTINFLFTLMFSFNVFAVNPHGPDVAGKLLLSDEIQEVMSKRPGYYFSTLHFEESDDGWSEHTFALVLNRYDSNVDGPVRRCYWVNYDEKLKESPVTSISEFTKEKSCNK